MHPFFIYLVQVNIALALFYLLYVSILKKDTFLRLRRFFFLSAILFSLLYPLFTVPALSNAWMFPAAGTEEGATTTTVTIGEPSMTVMIENDDPAPVSIPWGTIFFLLYLGVTLVFISRFFVRLGSIYSIRAKCEKRTISGTTVYHLKEDITPFSFFNLIFIHEEQHPGTELTQVLLHEQAHVKQAHSVDIVLAELLCIFFWWNPFVWLMKREMIMNLEYLADNDVLLEGIDTREYQYHLLRLTYHESAAPLVNNFNVSLLKQRVMMMNKTKSPALRLMKYFAILPVCFLLVTTNSVYAGHDEEATAASETSDPATGLTSVSSVEPVSDPPPVKKGAVTEEIFVVVEEQPEFPGGTEAMMKFLSDSIVYPKEAHARGIQGRVICNFVVMKDGTIDSVNIVRGIDPLLDAEAVRVLESMPKWEPGRQRGQAVNVRFTLPVTFRVNKPEEESTSEESSVLIGDLRTNEASMSVSVQVMQDQVFPGGEEGFMRYVSDNIRYPVEAQEKGIQGLVNATLTFRNDGYIGGVEVQPDSGDETILSKEVLRVITNMPEWEKGASFIMSGRVTGSGSSPIQGASVVLKGTHQGTITDANGNFQLAVPSKDATVAISFIGYKTQEIALASIRPSNGGLTKSIPVVFRLQGDDGSTSYTGPTPDNAVVVVGYSSN